VVIIILSVVLFFIFIFSRGETESMVLRPLFGLLYQPQMIDDDDDYEAIGGIRIVRGN
jgi:hypothetical protein